MKAILTSTSDRNFEFNYRLPNGQVATVFIPAYALNHEVPFPSEEVFATFKQQNSIYFTGDKPVLIEGKASGAKAEKIYTERETVRAKAIKKSADAAIDQVASATQDSGVKIDVAVETTGGGK